MISAFEQLLAEGYLVTRLGSGTYVSADLPEPTVNQSEGSLGERPHNPRSQASRSLDDVDAAWPAHTDTRAFNTGRTLVDARTAEVWRRLVHQAARSIGPSDLGYSDPRGLPELRATIAEYLGAARAVQCEPDQVIVTAGTQHAIDLATRVLLRPGATVWVEDPGYPLTRRALEAAGIAVYPIPVDEHGLIVAAGKTAEPKARAVFVTPSHQYPTGVVLSMARRLELLAWAREQDAWIIEDDYVSEFRYSGRPLASLQGLDRDERVIYVGTLNKALFPGLRLGYVVVPPPLVPVFAQARDLVDRQAPSLIQVVAAEFMQQGHLAAHIRRMRLQYRGQRDALAETLKRHAEDLLDVAVPDQGMHLVARLRVGISDVAVEQAAFKAGVIVRAVSRLHVRTTPKSALMLGFSGYPREVIIPAAARLAEVVRSVARQRVLGRGTKKDNPTPERLRP